MPRDQGSPAARGAPWLKCLAVLALLAATIARPRQHAYGALAAPGDARCAGGGPPLLQFDVAQRGTIAGCAAKNLKPTPPERMSPEGCARACLAHRPAQAVWRCAGFAVDDAGTTCALKAACAKGVTAATPWARTFSYYRLLSAEEPCRRPPTGPSVLFLLVDDLGYHDLSTTGSQIYQTPAIDKLAAASVTFGSAYASYPRCVPSRYAIFSGKYPATESVASGDIIGAPESENVVKRFRGLGYRTFFTGKWHLGDWDTDALGFDEAPVVGDGVEERFYPFKFNHFGTSATGTRTPSALTLNKAARKGDFVEDALAGTAIEFVLRQRAANAPFFAVVSFFSVHGPYEAPAADTARNKAEIERFGFDAAAVPRFVVDGSGTYQNRMRQDNAQYVIP